MRFEIEVRREFSAAHAMRLPGGGLEPVHGHNWKIEIGVGADQLDALGTVMDFHELEAAIDRVVSAMHNRHLNDLPPFDAELNPSAENVAVHLARAVKLPANIRLMSVRVWETDGCCAIYRPAGSDDPG